MGYWDKQTPQKDEAESQIESGLEALERDCLAELSETERGFRERMKNENARFLDMCDTEYWFCVCFTSRKQKEEFLKKIGIDPTLKYIDGREMAKACKKSLQTPDIEFARVRPFDKEYVSRAADF